jgi:hypothetical protein
MNNRKNGCYPRPYPPEVLFPSPFPRPYPPEEPFPRPYPRPYPDNW